MLTTVTAQKFIRTKWGYIDPWPLFKTKRQLVYFLFFLRKPALEERKKRDRARLLKTGACTYVAQSSSSLSQDWRSVEPNRRKTMASMVNMDEHSRKAIRHRARVCWSVIKNHHKLIEMRSPKKVKEKYIEITKTDLEEQIYTIPVLPSRRRPLEALANC